MQPPSGGASVLISGSVARLFQAAFSLLINALVAHLLPVSSVGTYYALLVLVSVAMVVVSAGGPTELLRNASAQRSSGRKYVWSLVITGTISVLMLLLVSGGGRSYVLQLLPIDVSPTVLLLASLLAVSSAFQSTVSEELRGRQRFAISACYANYGSLGSLGFGLLQSLLVTLFALVALYSDFEIDLKDLLIFSVATSALVASYGVFRVWRGYGGAQPPAYSLDAPISTRIGQRIGFAGVGVLAILQSQIDLLVVSTYFPASEVGMYGTAQRLTLPLLMPLMLTTYLAQPHMGFLFANRPRTELAKFCGSLAALLFIVTIVAAGTLLPARHALLQYIFGDAYLAAGGVVVWKTAGIIALCATGLANSVFVICGRAGALLIINATTIVSFGIYCSYTHPVSIDQIARVHALFLLGQSGLIGLTSHFGLQVNIFPSPRSLYSSLLRYRR